MKTTKIFAILLSLACSIGLFSCSEDSAQMPLANPAVTSAGQSYESLSFSWNAIPNAVQYGYRLTDETEEYAKAGVTKSTEVNFNGLQPATTYKLEVWAFAAIDGDYSTPPAVTLTATTDPLIKLGTPQSLTIDEAGGIATAKWSPVDSAESYDYEVTSMSNAVLASGNTDKTSIVIKSLPEGDYKLLIYATTSVGGYETSDAATATFHVSASEIWRANGTYFSIWLNSSWPATIVAYSNSTYKILAYYGVEGYDLEFAVNESNAGDSFSFINGELYENNGWKCWNVPTGIAVPDKIWAYPWDDYSYYYGDSTGGEVGIGSYYGDDLTGWGYDTFTWGGASLDINTLPGAYATHCFGNERNSDTGWKYQEFDYEGYDSTILLEGDNIISLDNFYWDDCPVFGEVDTENRIITFEAQDMIVYDDGEKYVFGAKGKSTDPVVATVNENGSITVNDFAIWYIFNDGSDYLCTYGTVELTKSSASNIIKRKPSPRMSAKASVKRKATSPKGSRPAKR